ncbi:hypothetical protein FSOLCH5_010357 [Fusarium solani]
MYPSGRELSNPPVPPQRRNWGSNPNTKVDLASPSNVASRGTQIDQELAPQGSLDCPSGELHPRSGRPSPRKAGSGLKSDCTCDQGPLYPTICDRSSERRLATLELALPTPL